MANQAELEQEPSMEDILSSIKQILSEEDEIIQQDSPEDSVKATETSAPIAAATPAQDPNDGLDFASFGLDEEPEPAAATPVPVPESIMPKKSVVNDTFELKDEVVLNSNLIAPKVAQVSACALADITKKISSDKGFSLGQKTVTLEEIVRDVMRPMLKSWLDNNLPGIVENVVRKEVDRLIDIAKGM